MRSIRIAACVVATLSLMASPGLAWSQTSAHHTMHRHATHRHHHAKPHDRCHGMASGTAHHSCGTHTGGPSGGLH